MKELTRFFGFVTSLLFLGIGAFMIFKIMKPVSLWILANMNNWQGFGLWFCLLVVSIVLIGAAIDFCKAYLIGGE